MHCNRHHLFKEGSCLLARKLESFTRHSWMLLSFGEEPFHHTHCACHKTNCQLFHNVVSLFRSGYCSSQISTYCIKCVHTQLLNPTQHTKYYPLPSDLESSKLLVLGSFWQKMCMYYPRRWELAWRFHVPKKLLSVLFCPATAAVCLGNSKTFWDSK